MGWGLTALWIWMGCAWIGDADHLIWSVDPPGTTTDLGDTGDSGDTADSGDTVDTIDSADTTDSVPPLDTGPFDLDGDGVHAKDDCDDDDPDVSPDHDEVPCNGIDDNCSGDDDDGTTVPFGDDNLEAARLTAVSGDALCLEAGTWTGPLDFSGQDITIASLDGPEVTLLDNGGATGPAVRVASGEQRARLMGITVRNAVGGLGAGLWVSGSRLTAEDVIFESLSDADCGWDRCMGQLLRLDDAQVEFLDVWIRDSGLNRSYEENIFDGSLIAIRDGSTLDWNGGGLDSVSILEHQGGNGKDITLEQAVLRVSGGSELIATDLTWTDLDLDVEAQSSLRGVARTVVLEVLEESSVDLTRVDGEGWDLIARALGSQWTYSYCYLVVASGDSALTWTDSSMVDTSCASTVSDPSFYATTIGLYVSGGAAVIDGLTVSQMDISANDYAYGLSFSESSASLSHLDLRTMSVEARYGGDTGQGAAGLSLTGSSVSIDHLVMAGNEVASEDTTQGLVFVVNGADVSMEHGTLTGNSVEGDLETGATIYVDADSELSLLHTTIDNNEVAGNASSAFAWVEDLDDLTLSWSNVAENSGVTEWVLASDGTSRTASDGTGNQATDPVYASSDSVFPDDWDLRPGTGSVLLDNGDKSCTESDGTRCDIGAYGGEADW